MYLVVGLGNPDKKYLNTMHNMGFMAIDKVANSLGVNFNKKEFKGVTCQTAINGQKVVLLKPYTYMNLSGSSVVEAVNFYKIPLKNIIVIYDDIDLNKGALRIREKGSAGTHNGMRDIVEKLNSGDFARVRVGIKPTNFLGALKDYVLSQVTKDDKDLIDSALLKASDAAIDFVNGVSMQSIMQKYNG